MYHLSIISITAALLLSPLNLHAKSVNQDLELCAAKALKEQINLSTQFSVETAGLNPYELDHDASKGKAQYRMKVVNGVSGEELGVVSCKVGKSGDVLAAVFES
jgi:hypothetical protein